MDWVSLATLALYISAITISVTNARDHDWGRRKMAGVAIFLLGAGVVLFLDDAIAAVDTGPAALSTWSVPAGAALMVIGGLVVWRRAELDLPTE